MSTKKKIFFISFEPNVEDVHLDWPFHVHALIFAYAYDLNVFLFFPAKTTQFALKLLGRSKKPDIKDLTKFFDLWPLTCRCSNHLLQFSAKFKLAEVVVLQIRITS